MIFDVENNIGCLVHDADRGAVLAHVLSVDVNLQNDSCSVVCATVPVRLDPSGDEVEQCRYNFERCRLVRRADGFPSDIYCEGRTE